MLLKVSPEGTECHGYSRLFGSRKMIDSKQLQILLFICVTVLLLNLGHCYDPCPESLRGSSKGCNIPDSEKEKAFQEAKRIVQGNVAHEKKLKDQGRTVNKKIKSAKSTHQQANAPPRAHEMEHRQLVFAQASNILAKKYRLNDRQKCCDLPKMSLRTPTAARAVQECTANEGIECNSSAKYRTVDGTCNNLGNPRWGSAFSCFNRVLPTVYAVDDRFRESVRGGPLPQPRILSVYVHNNIDKPTNYVNHLYMFFGQLLDHDITFTAQSMSENNTAIECCPPRPDDHPQCAPITIPSNDTFYSQFSVTCLNFVRSGLCPFCTTGPRVQVNTVTAYIDGSFVYGNNVNETNNLRNNDGTGTLRIQRTQVGDLLPRSNDPQNDGCSIPAQNQICFQTGDQRANQHPALTSLHTVFVREHNRIATILRSFNPRWNEETIFQETRRIVGALMQVITYKEYLPITLGYNYVCDCKLWICDGGQNTSYDSNVDPSMSTEFSTAAFRFGHTLVNSRIVEMPTQQNHQGHYLRDKFFDPFGLYDGEVNSVLRGSTNSSAQCFDRHMVPDVTNFLYRIRGAATGLDLASFNIQRGRDHGLERYVECVRYCLGIIVQSFEDLWRRGLMTYENMNILRRNYMDVRDIDLFTGIISEIWMKGAVVGPTAACFIGKQFCKLKFGDRFYFEHSGQTGSFSRAQMDELRKASLSRLLCDNTDITRIQKNAMLFASDYNPVVQCNELPAVNLQCWRQ